MFHLGEEPYIGLALGTDPHQKAMSHRRKFLPRFLQLPYCLKHVSQLVGSCLTSFLTSFNYGLSRNCTSCSGSEHRCRRGAKSAM